MRIKELRKAAGISQAKLGAICGLTKATISQYEIGNREPDISTLLRIANYFNVSVDYLLGVSNEIKTGDEILQEHEKQLLQLFRLIPAEKQNDAIEKLRDELYKMSIEPLLNTIVEMNDKEIDQLSSYIDFIVSKRK